jgi:hypothetical protein
VKFDESYFRRFYQDPATRVHSVTEVGHIVQAVTSLLAWYRCPLRTVLDVGAGTGEWGDWFRANRPEVVVRSVDVSEYACRTYGHEQHDISSWQSGEQYDLVVCQGVLGYLDDAACAAAVDNLAAMTRGFLWLNLISAEDVRDNLVDRQRSDLAVHIRPVSFYLDLLRQYYVRVGAGLFKLRDAPLALFALERLDE